MTGSIQPHDPVAPRPPRSRLLFRGAFALYAPILFSGTHWPALVVEGPVPRSDIWVHLGAFGLWMTLATLAGFFGPALSGRNIARTLLLALLYAAFDEGTQAIPILRRTPAWDDYAANAAGILLAATALRVLGVVFFPARATPRDTLPS